MQEVYDVIVARQAIRDSHLKAFKEKAIKTSAIADQVKAARRTIYNKDFVKKFIDVLRKEEEKDDPCQA